MLKSLIAHDYPKFQFSEKYYKFVWSIFFPNQVLIHLIILISFIIYVYAAHMMHFMNMWSNFSYRLV